MPHNGQNTTPCRVAGCRRPYGVNGTAHGYCRLHYFRWYRTGDPLGMRKRASGLGSYDGNGYHVLTRKGVRIRAHRLIAEAMLGRALLSHEVVHHRDGNKRNNDPLNLEVMSRADHMRLHKPSR